MWLLLQHALLASRRLVVVQAQSENAPSQGCSAIKPFPVLLLISCEVNTCAAKLGPPAPSVLGTPPPAGRGCPWAWPPKCRPGWPPPTRTAAPACGAGAHNCGFRVSYSCDCLGSFPCAPHESPRADQQHFDVQPSAATRPRTAHLPVHLISVLGPCSRSRASRRRWDCRCLQVMMQAQTESWTEGICVRYSAVASMISINDWTPCATLPCALSRTHHLTACIARGKRAAWTQQ